MRNEMRNDSDPFGHFGMEGGKGDDVYLVAWGDGPEGNFADSIYETDDGGVDTIRFGTGIGLADVSTITVSNNGQYNGRDFMLEIGSSTGSGQAGRLLVKDGLKGSIERFEFADGRGYSASRRLRRMHKSRRWWDGDSNSGSANQGTWRAAA